MKKKRLGSNRSGKKKYRGLGEEKIKERGEGTVVQSDVVETCGKSYHLGGNTRARSGWGDKGIQGSGRGKRLFSQKPKKKHIHARMLGLGIGGRARREGKGERNFGRERGGNPCDNHLDLARDQGKKKGLRLLVRRGNEKKTLERRSSSSKSCTRQKQLGSYVGGGICDNGHTGKEE